MLGHTTNSAFRPNPAAIHRVDDRQWEAIVDLLPTHLAVRARNRAQDYRTFLDGVLWVVGEEAFWAELPECFGHHWRALYVRFLRWNHVGVWNTVADVIGRDSALARSLMRRSDQHTAIVRRRRMRNVPCMFEGLREANRHG